MSAVMTGCEQTSMMTSEGETVSPKATVMSSVHKAVAVSREAVHSQEVTGRTVL